MIQFKLKNTYFFLVSLVLLLTISYSFKQNESLDNSSSQEENIIVGANKYEEYSKLLLNKKVAVVANQTSLVEFTVTGDKGIGTSNMHLVDFLLKINVDVQKIFSPEHGFRGKADAGEFVEDGKDIKTGLPIFSLHGKHKKPSTEQLKGIDVVVFDIQDVGVRFYTYISTMHYVMEACAENEIPVIVLDRPNPNAHYVDGPVLEKEHQSFLGMHPVPVVYGMTIGEYALMINGENWLKNGVKCKLTIVKLENYNHTSKYRLPVRPSPNLPNDTSINLYPSLGFFEGTPINAGRGTEFQFQRYGSPDFPESDFSYTPKPNFGAKYPKHAQEKCFGVDLSQSDYQSSINLEWLLDAYNKTSDKKSFFGATFTAHAGTKKLQQQIEKGKSAEKIKESWQKDLEAFKKIREKYLIYK